MLTISGRREVFGVSPGRRAIEVGGYLIRGCLVFLVSGILGILLDPAGVFHEDKSFIFLVCLQKLAYCANYCRVKSCNP